MPFDAGMLAASVYEINSLLDGARVEKIIQPSRDEILLFFRARTGVFKLLINAGSNSPRLALTDTSAENLDKTPMFCQMLRRHLAGSRLASAVQVGFERVTLLEFNARDEMGFDCIKHLVVETMGKYSNLILTDGGGKIISALKIVDFTTSSKRQVLPGMRYELPPQQDKLNPLAADTDTLSRAYDAFPRESTAEKFITSTLLGISATVAREVVFRATRHADTPLAYCDKDTLLAEIFALAERVRSGSFEPCVVCRSSCPAEYSFLPLTQYGDSEVRAFSSVGALLDTFYGERDREQRVRRHTADLLKLLTTAESRLRKKLDAQQKELADCEKGGEFKEFGDLITANIYKLSRGDTKVLLTDYFRQDPDGCFLEREIELDSRLTPAANAQRYYKKYAKTKTAKAELTKQIKLGQAELEYIYSVFDALSHAETAQDLAEIREELSHSGYASRVKTATRSGKQSKPAAARFVTSGGFTVLCGKNNLQNEYITFKLAEKEDWWFHVKGTQGSHVLLVCDGREPDVKDFTEAAEIAAHFSRADGGEKVDVDYTKAKNVKKPSNAKPGLVIYHTNWSCTVSPSADKIDQMRV